MKMFLFVVNGHADYYYWQHPLLQIVVAKVCQLAFGTRIKLPGIVPKAIIKFWSMIS
jgi:hypothetical protein